MPELMEENNEAAHVYSIVKNQAILSNGMPVDLRFDSVRFVFELYGVSDRRAVFERVLKTWHEMNRMDRLKILNRKR